MGQRLQDIEEKLHELGRRIQRIEDHLMSQEREQEQEQEAPRDDRIFDNEP